MSPTSCIPVTDLPSPEWSKLQGPVEAAMASVTATNAQLDDPSMEDSFFVCDLGSVARQFEKWQRHLGFVRPHYAVKCNNDGHVLRALAQLGCNFDCASFREIEQVLGIGVDASRVIYANTVKNPSYVRWARDHGVKRMTFDNEDELYKIKEHAPESELLLRIITDDSQAVCQLSCKFGAPLETTKGLLSLAQELGLRVIGVAFHVGSGGGGADAYPKALRDAAKVIEEAAVLGMSLGVVDIGGGFEDSTFEANAASIRGAVEDLGLRGFEIIAEPGRFMVAEAFTLVSSVVGLRRDAEGRPSMVYVSDGCYGNLNCIIYDHQTPEPRLLGASGPCQYTASVWGPTCDGIDCISAGTSFPRPVRVGDWIYFEGVGAYTLSASTTFNGFNFETRVHYVG